jgi:putative ABC transport system permease protein
LDTRARHIPAAPLRSSRLLVVLWACQECFRLAVSSIRAQGLRSLLTVLGVVIGISSVICVIALMQGLTHAIVTQFESLGSNTLTVRAKTPRIDALRGKISHLTPEDIDELRLRVSGIENITPLVVAGPRLGEVHSGSKVANGTLLGTTGSFQDVYRLFPRHGRFLTAFDDKSRRRVVVLGEQIRKDLELEDNPVGEFVQVGSEWYKVVGLMETRGEVFGQSQDSFVLMPYQTALAVIGLNTTPDLWVTFSVVHSEELEAIRQQVIGLLRRRHGLIGDAPDDFSIQSAESVARVLKSVSMGLTLVISGIVGISLLVGGIGIMNIMLVSVTERTREIGIAKALGAPRGFVLFQFLIEAVMLALIGGVLGVALGFGVAYVLGASIASAVPSFPLPFVPWWSVAGALAFSTAVGVGFGLLPATKAANLAPIEALRYE